MKLLIHAIEELFTAATLSGGALAKTAHFTLENVNWQDTLNKPEQMRHPVVNAQLPAACANSGPHGSRSHGVAQALLAVADQLEWRASGTDRDQDPDVAIFAPRFAATTIIGEGGLLPSDKLLVGFSLQGRTPIIRRMPIMPRKVTGSSAAMATGRSVRNPGSL